MAQVNFPAVFTAGETCYIYGDDFEKKYGAINSGESAVIINTASVTDTDETVYQLAWSMQTGYTDNFWLTQSEIAASNGTIREANEDDLAVFGVLEEDTNHNTCRVKRKGTKLLYGPADQFYSAGRVNPSKALLILATYPNYFLVRKESGPDDINATALSGFVKIEDVEVEMTLTDDDIENLMEEGVIAPVEEIAEKVAEKMVEKPEPIAAAEAEVAVEEEITPEVPTEEPEVPTPTPAPAPVKSRPLSRESTILPTNPLIDYAKCTVLAVPCDETRAESLEQKLGMINATYPGMSGVERFVRLDDAKGFSDIDSQGYHNLPSDYENRVYVVVTDEYASAIKKKLLAQGFKPTMHQLD